MTSERKSKSAADLPIKPVAEELVFVRKSFKELIGIYATHVEEKIARLQALLSEETKEKRKHPASRIPDLRDMLMLLRNFDIKPAKGRRRDLKKIDNLLADLLEIAERWESSAKRAD